MSRWRLFSVLMALLLTSNFTVPNATARTEKIVTLTDLLRERTDNRRLELTFTDGLTAQGFVIAIHADTLQFHCGDKSGLITKHLISDITRVRQWKSNAANGASLGALSGGLIVGTFGVLVGAYVASIDDVQNSDVTPYFVGAATGAVVGAFAGGTLGMGVGALIPSWQQLWPAEIKPPTPQRRRYSKATRVGLFAGLGTPVLEDYEVTRFVGRVSLRKNAGSRLSMGPEIAFHDFGGHIVTQQGNSIYTRSTDSILKVGFVTNIRSNRAGLAPYGSLGLGWFLSDDAYLGGHAGGGLRLPISRSNDLEFDVRYHFSFNNLDPGAIERFWTLGVGWGFGL